MFDTLIDHLEDLLKCRVPAQVRFQVGRLARRIVSFPSLSLQPNFVEFDKPCILWAITLSNSTKFS